jgi:glycosyltransferase involved in cell wall biosynthesis
MRILWVSNAPWAATGYANQTRLFAPRIQAQLGHEVGILAFWGLEGAALHIGDGAGGEIPIFPRGFHLTGQDVVGIVSERWKADVTISLMDAWVCHPEMYGPRVRWAPWFPIDHEPVQRVVVEPVRKAFRPITMSRFGAAQAEQAGIEAAYVPHGVETSVFCPGDKAAARERAGLPQDRWIVGMVAANKGQPSRKALPQHLEAFAAFHRAHPDSLLYLHTLAARHGEHQGVNIPELCEMLGIAEAVRLPDHHRYMLGYPDEAMVDLYRSFDVFMNVSAGEGFGIPILEAQACGVPVIVGDWTAMAELCFAGWAVDRADALRTWTGLGSYQWTPRPEAITECLEHAYGMELGELGEQARAQALAYDADTVAADYWRPVLDDIEERITVPVGRSFAQAIAV